MLHQKCCKGTTKNAHTQVNEKLFSKKDRFIYLIYPSAAIGSLLTDGCRWEYDRVLTIFENNCERTGVWAAFCERTFGGMRKAQAASEGTNTHTRKQ